jgi:NHL repeat
MGKKIGLGNFVYEVAEGWGNLPRNWEYVEVVGVAVDSRDDVYVYTRGKHPVIVFDRDGGFMRSWGQDFLTGRPHAIYIDADDFVWLVDDRDHLIYKCTRDGIVVSTIGKKGQCSLRWSGLPFNLPTHVAVSHKTGKVFVADGYGNARIHRYSREGLLEHSWGSPGVEPGHFAWPHNIVLDADDNLYVADRENHRIQVFDPDGDLISIWHDIYRPCALAIDGQGHVFVGELGADVGLQSFSPGLTDCPCLGNRLSIYNRKGELLSRVGEDVGGEGPGQFLALHGAAIDSRDDLYVGEVSWSMRGQHLKPPRYLRSLQKLVRQPKMIAEGVSPGF